MSRKPKAPERIPIVLPTKAQDKAITAAAKRDPDAQPLSAAQLKAMVSVKPAP